MVNMFKENQFHHPEWVNALMLKYVSLYKNALDCELSGLCPVSKAWQAAFDENKSGRITPAGQLLISISAHVNRDLPIALASLDSTKFADETYQEDFRNISTIFLRRMPEMIKIVQEYESCNINTFDQEIITSVINFAIGRTREKSWVYGSKLALVKTTKEENALMGEIEAHAHRENLSIYIVAPAPAFLICL